MHDKKNIMEHLQQHQDYPATKEELVEECKQLSDFSKEDKAWFEHNLSEGTYNSPQDVMQALETRQQTSRTM